MTDIKSDYAKQNYHVERRGQTLSVTLTYPPRDESDVQPEKCRYVEVDQESVRASDGVRLHYDYERDGFAIEQRVHFETSGGSYFDGKFVITEHQDEEWTEVAFVRSWASLKDELP